MYMDTTNNLNALLGINPENLEERAAKIQALREKYHGELRPAFRAACRAYLAFAKAACRVSIICEEFRREGTEITLPNLLAMKAADLVTIAKLFVESGFIDPDDSILDGITG
jgi:hypothetical protein